MISKACNHLFSEEKKSPKVNSYSPDILFLIISLEEMPSLLFKK